MHTSNVYAKTNYEEKIEKPIFFYRTENTLFGNTNINFVWRISEQVRFLPHLIATLQSLRNKATEGTFRPSLKVDAEFAYGEENLRTCALSSGRERTNLSTQTNGVNSKQYGYLGVNRKQ